MAVLMGQGSLRATLPLIFSIWLSACASLTPTERQALETAVPVRRAEIQTPFFPQEIHQCGPAALASVLNWAGVAITPEALVNEVYVPGRKGSLQLELVAATRHHERVPYVLAPELTSLFTEVQAGHPVVVLQNLAFNWYPRWHFAVVIGYDQDRKVVILHSGREKREVLGLDVFLHTWDRSGRWAMLALPADRMPATVQEDPYLQAVSSLEQQGHRETAHTAYVLALQRWPDNLVAQLGLGNIAYAQGELEDAVNRFRTAVRAHPESAAAHNNLAYVLADQGRLDEAEEHARQALSLSGTGSGAEAADTLARIRRLRDPRAQ